MVKHSARKICGNIGRLLSYCEAENDFWPNARYFFEVGEAGLAFEGIFIYLLSRNDLWKQHHSLIKSIRASLSEFIDFEDLELSVLDGGRYSESRATFEWRQAIVRELNNNKSIGQVS